MSNSDFFSLFPAEDATPEANSDELTQLFDQDPPADNGELAEAQLDNFEIMFDEILLDTDTELETTAVNQEEDREAAVMAINSENEINAAVMAIEAEEFEFVEMEWDDLENGPTTDLAEAVDEIDDHDEQPGVFAHPLTPPFLQSYQTLQVQVAQLTQQIATAEQQLTARQRRADSAEALIQQQAIALTQAQEQLSHTVAELQIHQEETKRQQLQVETLAEKLSQSQAQLKDVTVQLAHSQAQLAIAITEKQTPEAPVSQDAAQVSRLEKHVDELRSRLQRQQRYALQYKSALEQCLAQPDFHPSSDISQVVARLTGKNTDSQPWASVGDILAAFPQSPEIESPRAPRSESLGDRPATMATPNNVTTSTDLANPIQPTTPIKVVHQSTATTQQEGDRQVNAKESNRESRVRRPLGLDTLSFAVREPKKAPARHVELPNFLPRAASISR